MSEGVDDLIHLWADAPNDDEREAAEADLHDALEDREPALSTAPTIESHDDVDARLHERRALKARLRRLVEKHGGVTEVARQAGMPQPSLSRLLTSMSEPRPGTLLRLAPVLGLSGEELLASRGGPIPTTVFRTPVYEGRIEMMASVRYRVAAGLLEAS